PRTLSLRAVGVGALALSLLVLGAGVAIGYGVAGGDFPVKVVERPAPRPEPLQMGSDGSDAAVDGSLLINRFGELSGRMSQLEAEARELAVRVEGIKAVNPDEEEPQGGRVARTPPGSPSGGPLLSPGSGGESGARPEGIDGGLSWLEKEIE